MNRFVMAHEFFHYVFDLKFMAKTLRCILLMTNVLPLSSLNEGLADFFAWLTAK